MEECIFCKIIDGKIPSYKLYEDDKIMAFLDINPVNAGHVLVIPKEHHKMMSDTPDELVSYLYVKCKNFMKDIKEIMKADYVALAVVGVDVPHFHVHLIPRYFDDGLAGFWPTKKYNEGEVEGFIDNLKKRMNKNN